MAPHLSRWARFALLLFVAVACLAVGACGDPGGRSHAAGEAVSPVASLVGVADDALFGVGTPLFGGVTVTADRGRVPFDDAGTTTTGSQAALLLTGDPLEVWTAYATALGMATATAASSCVVRATQDLSPDGTVPERLLTEDVIDGENLLSCTATVDGTTLTMDVGATVDCVPGDADCSPRPVANMFITRPGSPLPGSSNVYGAVDLLFERWYSRVRDAAAPKEECGVPCSVDSDDLVGHVVAPDLDLSGVPPSTPPGPGQPLDDGIDPYGLDDFTVPAGARSLVAPALLIRCNSGLVAVLDLPGTPEDAASMFDDANDTDDPILTTRSSTDPRSLTGLLSTAGGYYLSLAAVPAAGGRTTALVTECGD